MHISILIFIAGKDEDKTVNGIVTNKTGRTGKVHFSLYIYTNHYNVF